MNVSLHLSKLTFASGDTLSLAPDSIVLFVGRTVQEKPSPSRTFGTRSLLRINSRASQLLVQPWKKPARLPNTWILFATTPLPITTT